MSKVIIMEVEGKPVYVGDKLIFTPDWGDLPYIREVFIQHKALGQNPDWVKQWSRTIKTKQ